MTKKQLKALSTKVGLPETVIINAIGVLETVMDIHRSFQLACEEVSNFCRKSTSHFNLLVEILILKGYDLHIAEDTIEKYAFFGKGSINTMFFQLSHGLQTKMLQWEPKYIEDYLENPIVNAVIFDQATGKYEHTTMDFRLMNARTFNLAFTNSGINRNVRKQMSMANQTNTKEVDKVSDSKVHFTAGYHTKKEVCDGLVSLVKSTTEKRKLDEIMVCVNKMLTEIKEHIDSLK